MRGIESGVAEAGAGDVAPLHLPLDDDAKGMAMPLPPAGLLPGVEERLLIGGHGPQHAAA